ncbi:MAG: tRNA (uridine(34)/cytosine(34)/5-carboxymethylaminomethyluridine(34)-2'-O)-methyltransferase TrmL [Chloroflexi bacterium]|nr:tRNA (uridine(34)/cytosine(34)/5-carboxymethylaminomethyluridine(34)-2'-O)-methyltransferase TrmL [Chloroflexota bacterium]|tara:strand:- start:27046 stop:27510 length:465 start_codon:yes stop_codon:yes gene_type:complete
MNNSLHIILYNPKIAYNTGNIIRLCANIGAELHLIKPLGFSFESRQLKRAALDYSDLTKVFLHENLCGYLEKFPNRDILASSIHGKSIYTEINYTLNHSILFGSEDAGLPKDILDWLTIDRLIKIPMKPFNRSMNVSNTVAIIAYEVWRQVGFV